LSKSRVGIFARQISHALFSDRITFWKFPEEMPRNKKSSAAGRSSVGENRVQPNRTPIGSCAGTRTHHPHYTRGLEVVEGIRTCHSGTDGAFAHPSGSRTSKKRRRWSERCGRTTGHAPDDIDLQDAAAGYQARAKLSMPMRAGEFPISIRFPIDNGDDRSPSLCGK
jgi:hypothetical protein